MTDTRDFTPVIEQMNKAAEIVGLSADPEKHAFYREMMREEQYGLAFDTLEDFVGEQESEDMVALAGVLWRLRSLLELPRR